MNKFNDVELNIRKIFFLYPTYETENKVIRTIVKNEFEAYALYDYMSAVDLLYEFNNSILLINEDYKIKKIQWEHYINSIIENITMGDIKIGVYKINDHILYINKYLTNFQAPFLEIKYYNSIIECIPYFITIFQKFNARGIRKYVRVKCNEMGLAFISIKYNDNIYRGELNDISSFGMACIFQENIYLKVNTYLDDIQLRLKGIISKISGKVIGIRKNENRNIYVIMFDVRNNPRFRYYISDFIYSVL